MVMVIKSNVPSNIIANPDGWNPPFNTDGLLYAGIYGRGNLSKNFAAGGADAVVSGSPVVSNHFATFDLNNFIDTGVPTTKETTLIAVVKKVNPTLRQFFISSYNGTGDAGRSLVIDKGTARLTFYSHYKNTETNANTVLNCYATLNVTAGEPAFIYGRDTGKKINVASMTDKLSGENIPKAAFETIVNPELKYRIGRGISSEVPGASDIGAALIFDRALSDAEIKSIYDYFQAYYARRGISI
ncbi:hypothetical protein RRJ51_16880 [Klebsiella pneumoniae]|uniref:hypothetical protein n=1 Tax=Klebsiella pneumoniae TaxID=573 RepID=UPI0028FC281C|nr:hypothetical protein [Klebsiella pneumoniae]WNV95045.1 hypothetical protein RRJ51_16880 [Klebsiella pneumoniae]